MVRALRSPSCYGMDPEPTQHPLLTHLLLRKVLYGRKLYPSAQVTARVTAWVGLIDRGRGGQGVT